MTTKINPQNHPTKNTKMNRTTNKHLYGMVESINTRLRLMQKVGHYGIEFAYGHTNVVFYADPNSTGCSDVRAGLTKGEAYDVLQGIWHCLAIAIH